MTADANNNNSLPGPMTRKYVRAEMQLYSGDVIIISVAYFI